VQHPGTYFVAQGSSLVEALKKAGGFTDYAYLKRIRIAHQDSTVAECNYRKEGEHFVLADGDQILVKRIAPF
jgi:protein involved in polysaccharide export with SLBB domain